MMDNNWVEFLSTPPNFIDAPLTPNNDSSLQAQISPNLLEGIFEDAEPCSIKDGIEGMLLRMEQSDSTEVENRSLEISNIPASYQERLIKMLNQYGEVSSVSRTSETSVVAEYFDVRGASTAKTMLNGSFFNGSKLFAAFSPLIPISDPKNPPNNGTIVIFHLPSSISEEHLIAIFSHFGEIRQIRGTPTKLTQKFVEFWDTRSAAAALVKMNGGFIMGSKVSIEFSLPGGFRKGIQKVEAPRHFSPIIQKPQHR